MKKKIKVAYLLDNSNDWIKKLFNQIRIANNEKWSLFFIYEKKEYIIKIFEKNAQG